MSVIGQRRKRGLVIGLFGITIGLVITLIVGLIGVRTLATSRAGQAVSSAITYRSTFPYTPTGLIGVLGPDGSLASIAVLVVDPSGSGGTIIVVAPMADSASGTGDVLDPLDRVLAVEGIEAFADQAELMTRLSFDVIEVMTPDRFEALIGPVAPVTVNLPISVHDADSRARWPSGESVVSADEAVAILTARDPAIDDTYYLPAGGAVWAGIANAVQAGGDDDEADGPMTTPADMDELWGRLVAGPVIDRSLIAHKVSADVVEETLNPALFDPAVPSSVVVHDRAETVAIFAAIAPGRIGAPNAAARLRIVNPFTEDEVEAVGPGWDLPTMWKQVVDGLLFSATNVVSISEQPGADAPAITQVFVADGVVNDEDRDTLTVIFGQFEALPLVDRIEGVDATVVLGRSFLERLKTAQLPTPPVAPESVTADSIDDSTDDSTGSTGNSFDTSFESSTDLSPFVPDSSTASDDGSSRDNDGGG